MKATMSILGTGEGGSAGSGERGPMGPVGPEGPAGSLTVNVDTRELAKALERSHELALSLAKIEVAALSRRIDSQGIEISELRLKSYTAPGPLEIAAMLKEAFPPAPAPVVNVTSPDFHLDKDAVQVKAELSQYVESVIGKKQAIVWCVLFTLYILSVVMQCWNLISTYTLR